MRSVGAERLRRAADGDRRRAGATAQPGLHRHRARASRTIRGSSPAAGIGPGDCPPFDGHARGVGARSPAARSTPSIAILAGEVEHAFNPGGGLHHAMAARASGFCIYNDVALAVARARDAGHRVLYVDLDVHHGDGTQALFWDDPEVLTFSIHETGMSLFPGTGFVDETRRAGGAGHDGQRAAPAAAPATARGSRRSSGSLPALADAFKPTFLVTQHGCDTHAYDPLAHLRLTTRAYRAATTAARPTSLTSTATAAGWRPAAAATTRTGSCRARGRSSGWPRRIASRRTKRTRRGAGAGRPNRRASISRRRRTSSSIRRTWSGRSPPTSPSRMPRPSSAP